ncbi:MAG: hypothetical protein K6G60_06090 [Lachnospiraceae bacterium]|nr:hypothetical protein [Lachnospiraceae bacterium]
MEKMTSAYANKMIKSLEEDKAYWLQNESESRTYVVAVNESPVVPDYKYEEVAAKIAELDRKIATIRHSLNLANATAHVKVGGKDMSVDTILIRMAQLNSRKASLDWMRKQLPKTRLTGNSYSVKTIAAEYRYINYDLAVVGRDYEAVTSELMELQMALDRYNQVELIDVDI